MVENLINYLEKKDDRIGDFHGYTVVKEDDSRKINIRISNQLTMEVDEKSDDLAKSLFKDAIAFLKQRDGPWKIELTSKNSLNNKNFSPSEFSQLATEYK